MTTKFASASSLLTKQPRIARDSADHKHVEFDHQVIKRRIEKAGYEVFRITALSNGTGNQYWLLGGGVVIVYNTGTVVVGGKVSAKDKRRLERALRTR
ncbi:MAG: hypothetical protein ABI702_20970 [Burkholderiales bacterium]